MERIITLGSKGINSRASAIKSLRFILLFRRYSKLRGRYTPYNVNLTQKLVINELRKHLLFFSNDLTATM